MAVEIPRMKTLLPLSSGRRRATEKSSTLSTILSSRIRTPKLMTVSDDKIEMVRLTLGLGKKP